MRYNIFFKIKSVKKYYRGTSVEDLEFQFNLYVKKKYMKLTLISKVSFSNDVKAVLTDYSYW